MAKQLWTLFWATAGLAALKGACSPGAMIDRLPPDMGLPADAPARPETPYSYPAVHDMPPNRASAPMTEEDQVKLEKELTNLRQRQEGQQPAGQGSAAAKKTQKPAVSGQTDGAKPNP